MHLTQGWPGARAQKWFVDWLNDLVDAQGFNSGGVQPSFPGHNAHHHSHRGSIRTWSVLFPAVSEGLEEC